tara:strand:- start:1938 stop:2525 length:588 start_codon:yes stop_codon:yes gene_type:complete
MLPEYFILFDVKFTCNENIEDKKYIYEIINLYALKINYKNNNLIIIDKFDYYIKPIINPILSIQTIHNTNITQETINNYGSNFNKFIEDFYNFSNNINQKVYKLPLYSYNNDFLLIKNNLILNNFDKSSKYYIWENMFYDIKIIFKKYNINTDYYTSSTLYEYFIDNKSDKNIKIQTSNFNTYSLFIALQYLFSK